MDELNADPAFNVAAPAERDFLEQNPPFSEMAMRLAKDCDANRATACYRLANLYETGLGAPLRPRRALELYRWGCGNGSGESCRRAAAEMLQARLSPRDPKTALKFLRLACWMGHLSSCAAGADLARLGDGVPQDLKRAKELLDTACERGYAGACHDRRRHRSTFEQAGFDLPELQPLGGFAAPTAQAACPPAFHLRLEAGLDEDLSRGVAALDEAKLAAALPTAFAGWQGTLRAAPPEAQGVQVRRIVVDYGSAANPDWLLELSVADRVVDCTLEPGTGSAMLSENWTEGDSTREYEEGAFGRILWVERGTERRLELWLADRCSLSFRAPSGVPREQFRALLASIDMNALSLECARRD
ncbi:MAG: tetratricopeptide repeat protein [Myxococcota bacterium]|nr:tetratricopeptide repeat protein [Myxococcota bacterium]